MLKSLVSNYLSKVKNESLPFEKLLKIDAANQF